MDKAKLHQFLSNNPDVLEKLRRDATALPTRPTDPVLRMAFENGYAAYAAEMISLFNEVEGQINDRHNT